MAKSRGRAMNPSPVAGEGGARACRMRGCAALRDPRRVRADSNTKTAKDTKTTKGPGRRGGEAGDRPDALVAFVSLVVCVSKEGACGAPRPPVQHEPSSDRLLE